MPQDLDTRKVISIGILFTFLANTFGLTPVQADDFHLSAPGVMVHLSSTFNPPILKGIKVHPENPFQFDFILDQGNSLPLAGRVREGELKQDATRLIKYFLASLTIPEKDLWVNLSPYEKDRIIPQSFGLTEMGRDLLAEDYMLKQITASLIYPEDAIGKKFWKRVYQVAATKFGTTNIPVNTFNKVWIIPEKAVVYENAKTGTAYIVESKLKVMLEEDYLSLSKHREKRGHVPVGYVSPFFHTLALHSASLNDISSIGANIIREIVIPELTKEVNEGKNFSQLRQVYNSLILATWYKKKIKDSILTQVYEDKKKIAGVEPLLSLRGSEATEAISKRTTNDVEYIYQRYLQAFKKGVYNYIKEEPNPITQQTIPRKYFSGGINTTHLSDMAMTTVRTMDSAQLGSKGLIKILVDLASSLNPNGQVKKTTPDKKLSKEILQSSKDMLLLAVALAVTGHDFAQMGEEDNLDDTQQPFESNIPSKIRIPRKFLENNPQAYDKLFDFFTGRLIAWTLISSFWVIFDRNHFPEPLFVLFGTKVFLSYSSTREETVLFDKEHSVENIVKAYVYTKSKEQSQEGRIFRQIGFFLSHHENSKNKIVPRAFSIATNGDLIIYWEEPYIRQKLAPYIYLIPYWIAPLEGWRKKRVKEKKPSHVGLRVLKPIPVKGRAFSSQAIAAPKTGDTAQSAKANVASLDRAMAQKSRSKKVKWSPEEMRIIDRALDDSKEIKASSMAFRFPIAEMVLKDPRGFSRIQVRSAEKIMTLGVELEKIREPVPVEVSMNMAGFVLEHSQKHPREFTEDIQVHAVQNLIERDPDMRNIWTSVNILRSTSALGLPKPFLDKAAAKIIAGLHSGKIPDYLIASKAILLYGKDTVLSEDHFQEKARQYIDQYLQLSEKRFAPTAPILLDLSDVILGQWAWDSQKGVAKEQWLTALVDRVWNRSKHYRYSVAYLTKCIAFKHEYLASQEHNPIEDQNTGRVKHSQQTEDMMQMPRSVNAAHVMVEDALYHGNKAEQIVAVRFILDNPNLFESNRELAIDSRKIIREIITMNINAYPEYVAQAVSYALDHPDQFVNLDNEIKRQLEKVIATSHHSWVLALVGRPLPSGLKGREDDVQRVFKRMLEGKVSSEWQVLSALEILRRNLNGYDRAKAFAVIDKFLLDTRNIPRRNLTCLQLADYIGASNWPFTVFLKIEKAQWFRIQAEHAFHIRYGRDASRINANRIIAASLMLKYPQYFPAQIGADDRAMKASVSRNGGIDLTSANMNVQTKMDSREQRRMPTIINFSPNKAIGPFTTFRGNDIKSTGNDIKRGGNDNGGIKIHIDPAMLRQLQNAPGFVPVIINIQPMTDLRTFLGVSSKG